ncbi:hypothetical protein AbraIFM66950_006005 [Aspergillus brasiliensis]|nr:hypothetical protein AbraIFM66950_006005 [Aspergillus brasiliensis]
MASTYDLVNYDSDEEREKNPIVPFANLASAAFFMAGLLHAAGIPYGLMGGLAVAFLGSNRATRDVDMAFQAPGKMRDIWRVVEAQPRLIVPNTRLVSNILKVFVRTGPDYDDCVNALPVEVDLIESGFQNSPRELLANRKQISINTRTGVLLIYIIAPIFLMRGKMAAFAGRRRLADMEDIQHLVRIYGSEIRAAVDRLDPEDVTSFLEIVPPATLARWQTFFGR